MEIAKSRPPLVFLIRVSQPGWNVMNTHLGVTKSRPCGTNWIAGKIKVERDSARCSHDCFSAGAYSTQPRTESAPLFDELNGRRDESSRLRSPVDNGFCSET